MPLKRSISVWRGLLLIIFLSGLFWIAGLFNESKKAEAGLVKKDDISIPREIIRIEEDEVWNNDRVIEEAVMIEEGAILKIKKGVTVKFKRKEGEPAPFILVESGGLLVAEGTEKEKIKFTSDQNKSAFSLIFEGNNEGDSFSGYLRYAQISKAGGAYELEEDVNYQAKRSIPFISKAFAQEKKTTEKKRFPVYHFGGNLFIENCQFTKNKSADIYISDKDIEFDNFSFDWGRLVQVVNSNFSGNKQGIALASDYTCNAEEKEECKKLFLLKNNWYESQFGSDLINQSWEYYKENEDIFDDSSFQGQKVVGKNLEIDGFRTKDLIADPLIIIPGIMGSAEEVVGDDLILDPILHSYDNLIDSLKNNGYQKGLNLFTFPYNWRNSNVMTANKLKEKIKQVRKTTGASYVDLVAHSMGGLVARQYIQRNDYGYEVDQLITLGTPHKGAPKAYLMWEAGEGFFSWSENLVKHHFTREAKHNDYENLYSYIRKEVLSVRELLPDYNYLYDIEDESLREYSEDYPRNYFLEKLNSSEAVKDFRENKYIRFINIAGKLEEEKTINEIRVKEKEGNILWKHGKPENFGDKSTNQGLEFGKGDETVPCESATGIPADKTFEIDSTHTDLPTKAQCGVFKQLTGNNKCNYDEGINFPNILLFNVYSPVDIQIISPSGEKVGKDFEEEEVVNEIDMAYYSGFDTEEEFITIPNYEEGEYQIKTQGTGEGEFRIEAVSLNKTDEEGFTEKTEKTVQGEAKEGGAQEFSFAVGEESDQIEEEEDSDSGESEEDEGSGDQSSAIGDQDEEDSDRSSVIGNQNKKDREQASETGHQEEEIEEDSDQSLVAGDRDEKIEDDESGEDEENDEEEEDENDDNQSSVTNNQVASVNSHQSSEISDQDEDDSHQSSVIGDQENEAKKDSTIKDKESKNKNPDSEKENPSVKGEKTENNPLVIAGILLLGGVALTLTWTVGYQKE